jgi:single-stranded-DNA-specific exonuclease
VRSRQVGFRLVPRLNAVGRVARGKLAVDLLLAPDAQRASVLAGQLEAHNQSRRALEQAVTEAALERAAEQARSGVPAAFVLASEDWHPGVVGISAARLVDRYGVPAAVVGFQGGVGRGSVRTPPGIDVRAALDACAELLVKYGGHREAAGFSIEPSHVPEFARRFESAVRAQSGARGERPLAIDAMLAVHEIEPALAAAIERLEPFGAGHVEPAFLVSGLRAGARTRCVGDGHLKLELEAEACTLDGIAFGWGAAMQPADVIGRTVDVVAHVRAQDPKWGNGVQLVVVDVAMAAAAPAAAPAPEVRP